MKSSAKSFHKKMLLLISCTVVIALAAVVGLTVFSYKDSLKEFGGSGYILVPSDNPALTTDVNEMHYFSAGTSYREKFGNTISFKDTSNKDVRIDKEQFVHFTDGSLKSFTNGVVMSLTEVDEKQVSYFGVSDKTTIIKNATQYEMSYLGDVMQIQEFIWKIADDTYMVVAPEITVRLSRDKSVTLNDYVQIQYIDGEIVRLVHEQGTYQTVSSDAYIVTDGGVELRLYFIVDGKEALSLDSMVIDSDANLEVDENEDKLKLPTFNVVNGADGTNGDNGADGEDGDKGQIGESGDNGSGGNKGTVGGNGQNGQSGIDGSDGEDGEKGEQGELGYDGKDGEDGDDAVTSTSPDGIGSIEQPDAPRVTLQAEKDGTIKNYRVGANYADIWLNIVDKNGLLTDNLRWTIYTREGYDYVAGYDKNNNNVDHKEEGLISRTSKEAQVTTNKLQPDTEYVLIVTGTYATEYGEFTQDFLTKIFSTDTLGINLSKGQIFSDKITVKVNITEDSYAGTYGIALYRETDLDNPISIKKLLDSNVGTKEITFSADENLNAGEVLYPDSNYVVKLCNISEKDQNDILPIDISLDICTLKRTPHYLDETKNPPEEISITDMKTDIIPSDRYKTVTLSLEAGIKDPDSGIAGYRYELYKTEGINATEKFFVESKELDSLQNVTFDVDPKNNYFGRVVVLFKDNEKVVEIPSNDSDVVTMQERVYPVTDIVIDKTKLKYDYIEGTIVIEDKNSMLVPNIDASCPLTVLIIGEDGNTKGISITKESKVEPSGNKYVYTFSQAGLKADTTYTIRVTGPVNTTNTNWNEIADKTPYKDDYLAGINVTTPLPTTMSANFFKNPTTSGANAFEINYSISSVPQGDDAAYEVGNLEKIVFGLFDHNGNQIGIEYPVKDMDNDDSDHDSDFSAIYNKDAAAYNTKYVLTDACFGVAGDSRIVGGGDFTIKILDSADYTVDDEKYPYFTNKMNWDAATTVFNFNVTMRHAFSNDENSAITVEQIENIDAEGSFHNATLEDDTIVGLKLTPDYSWSDALAITYYVYKVDVRADEPFVGKDATLYRSNWRYLINDQATGEYIQPVGTKTIALSNGSKGTNVPPWTVYFDDDENTVDGGTTKLFERGYNYFVRYEVVCDGSIGGETAYPSCVYGSNDETPFYRTQIFSVNRQKPALYRYLWKTYRTSDNSTSATTDDIWTHEWKYLVNDPDKAVFAENAAPEFVIKQPKTTNYELAVSKSKGENVNVNLNTVDIGLTNLYTGSQWKSTYETLAFTGLQTNYYYNVELDYRLCNYVNNYYGTKTDTLSSKLYRVDDVTTVDTETFKNNDSLSHWQDRQDYHVGGILVKGIALDKGVVEEGGYRIKLTLQGDQIDRVAALKVVLTDATDSSKYVVYDPVAIEVATDNATKGTSSADKTIENSYANAYLAYAPLVEAEMTDKDVKVEVFAYCRTGNMGLDSFVNYKEYQKPETKLFTSNYAWAIKGNTYSDEYSYVEQSYFLSEDEEGSIMLEGSKPMKKVVGTAGIYHPTVQKSLILPYRTEAGGVVTNSSFLLATGTIEVAELSMMYASEPLAMFIGGQASTNNAIANALNQLYALANSQLPTHLLQLQIDENGLSDIANRYLTVEQLDIKKVMLDFGNKSDDFYIGQIKTGSGLPAIAINDNSTSIGRGSATLVFDTKGTFPDKYNDKTIYIELFDDVTGAKVTLNKYYYDDDNSERKYFYATSDYTPASYEHPCTGNEAKGTAIKYGTEGTDGTMEIVVRGLKPTTTYVNQKYYVVVYALNNSSVKQYLFDYVDEQIKNKYTFQTVGDINIATTSPTWLKPSYNGKNGQFRFAISGSEGTNMTIFFKVFDMNGNELKPGSQNSAYISSNNIGYGYRVAPLGNRIKYYDSDPTTNNPMMINLTPGGVLKLDTKYKLQITAYESYDGVVNYASQLGQKTVEFTTPQSFVKPRASVRISQGQTSIKATINMTDVDRIIMNDTYSVSLYDSKGNLVQQKSVTLGSSATNKVMSATVNFEELTENTVYTLKIEAPIDANNDGTADTKPFVEEINTSTISQAEASVVYGFEASGNLVFTLHNCTNFDNVGKVMYSIYSEDAKEFYKGEEVDFDVWEAEVGANGTSYSYEVKDWKPFVGVTYSYVIQYYNENGDLLGTTSGYFKKS
ncbi:MAG: collagen-like protein [Lachnospiraceae bacterium]|nr:collagen-like protein [Lachnospiraceae bacterium]